MKIRIHDGHLVSYVKKGGSLDEANPDPGSFETEVGTAPIKGHYLFYTLPDSGQKFIGLIDDVVIVGEHLWVFISSNKLAG